MAYVRTDTPIYHVNWYIDGTHVHGETLDSTTNYASYYPYDRIPGSVRGTKYTIGVKVWEWDADAEEFRSTTDSYVVRMFQPIETYSPETTPKKNPSASGYAALNRQYYNGGDIVMECSVSASSSKKGPGTWASSRFRHTLEERGAIIAAIERNHPLDDEGRPSAQPIGQDFSSYSHSDTLTHPDVGPFRDGRTVTSDAYVRLIVSGFGGEDHYLIENSEDFDHNDNE